MCSSTCSARGGAAGARRLRWPSRRRPARRQRTKPGIHRPRRPRTALVLAQEVVVEQHWYPLRDQRLAVEPQDCQPSAEQKCTNTRRDGTSATRPSSTANPTFNQRELRNVRKRQESSDKLRTVRLLRPRRRRHRRQARPLRRQPGQRTDRPRTGRRQQGMRLSCLAYPATQAVAVGAGASDLGIRPHPGAAAARSLCRSSRTMPRTVGCQAAFWKRSPRRLARCNFWRLADYGLNGAYCIDSAWHHGWETLAALVATTEATTRRPAAPARAWTGCAPRSASPSSPSSSSRTT